jgi:hypothetical protein
MQRERFSAAHRLVADGNVLWVVRSVGRIFVYFRGVFSIAEKVEGHAQIAGAPVGDTAQISVVAVPARDGDKFPGLSVERACCVPRRGDVADELKAGLIGVG